MLKIFYNATDLSEKLESYAQDTVAITLLSAEEIQIGYYKPINALYIENSTSNSNTSVLSVQYYNGTAFTNLTISDRTSGLARSGFVTWGRNQTNEALTTLNSLELYWYKLKVSVSTSAMVIKGINLVFSDEQALQEEYPGITKYYPTGQTSFINFHQTTRDDILQMIRNSGKKVKNLTDQKNLDQFDLLDFTEVKSAAKYFCLAKIFFWLSDEVDDKWYQKAKDYEQKASAQLSLVYLSIDSNDDGEYNQDEKLGIQFVRIERA